MRTWNIHQKALFVGLLAIIAIVLLWPLAAHAGIYTNTGTTSEDSLSIRFSLLDTLGNPVQIDTAADWGYLFVYYPGGDSCYSDSFVIAQADAHIEVNTSAEFTDRWGTYRDAVANLDGGGVNGTYTWTMYLRDSSLALDTWFHGEFQVLTAGGPSSILDTLTSIYLPAITLLDDSLGALKQVGLLLIDDSLGSLKNRGLKALPNIVPESSGGLPTIATGSDIGSIFLSNPGIVFADVGKISTSTAAADSLELRMLRPPTVVRADSIGHGGTHAIASELVDTSGVSTFDPTTTGVDATKISGDATAADNLETMLDGTGGHKLTLRGLNIVAAGTDSSGVVISGSGGAPALGIYGDATDTSKGILITAGRTATDHGTAVSIRPDGGYGLEIEGDSGGVGIAIYDGAATGNYKPVYLEAGGSYPGLDIATSGTGDGVHIVGGGDGIQIIGAANSHAVNLDASGSGDGINIAAVGTGDAIDASAGSSGGGYDFNSDIQLTNHDLATTLDSLQDSVNVATAAADTIIVHAPHGDNWASTGSSSLPDSIANYVSMLGTQHPIDSALQEQIYARVDSIADTIEAHAPHDDNWGGNTSAGSGVIACSLYTYTPANVAIPKTRIFIYNSDLSSQLYANPQEGTNTNGLSVFNLDASTTYKLTASKVAYVYDSLSTYQTILTPSSGYLIDTLPLTPYTVGSPAAASLKRIYGWEYGPSRQDSTGLAALQGLRVEWQLILTSRSDTICADTATGVNYTYGATLETVTDANGYWHLDIPLNSNIVPTGSRSKITCYRADGSTPRWSLTNQNYTTTANLCLGGCP